MRMVLIGFTLVAVTFSATTAFWRWYAPQPYASAVPNLAQVSCEFAGIPDKKVPSRAILVSRIRGLANWYNWIEYPNSPVPVLAIHHIPTYTLTSIVSSDTFASVSTVSYNPSGNAVLSTQSNTADGFTQWAAQVGHCTETKGT